MLKKALAELIGTFALVFFGIGSIHLDQLSDGFLSNTGISIVFGGTVALMVYLLGHISGAHINPAVSVGFWLNRRLTAVESIIYIGSQIVGATIAILIVQLSLPLNYCYGCTVPSDVSLQSAFWFEWLATFILMTVILAVSGDSVVKKYLSGISIGLTVMIMSLYLGPVTGASMNPARSLAPALAFAEMHLMWLYLSAPVLGATSAVLIWKNLVLRRY